MSASNLFAKFLEIVAFIGIGCVFALAILAWRFG